MIATSEQVEVVRSVKRSCRGPAIVPRDRQRLEYDKIRSLLDVGDVEGVWRAARDLALDFDLVPPEPTTSLEIALRLWSNVVGAHKENCSYDVNELILSQDLDGNSHSAECPRCGTLISWTAPKF